MAFLSLDVEIEYNFSLIAISSNQKSHSLCWAINKDLDAKLTLDSNYVVRSKSHVTEFRKYCSEVDGFSFVLLCNKNQNMRLVPELPTVDYFIKFYPDELALSVEEMTSRLRKLKMVQAIFMIDINGLKSKQTFIFD